MRRELRLGRVLASALVVAGLLVACVGSDPDPVSPVFVINEAGQDALASETSSEEAAVSDGGAGEASSDIEGGGGAGCGDVASSACDAFDDDGGTLTGKWSSSFSSGQSTIILDGADSLSPPNAVKASLAAESIAVATLGKELAFKGKSRLHADFDFKMDTVSVPSGSVVILFRVFGSSDVSPRIGLVASSTGAHLRYDNARLADGGVVPDFTSPTAVTVPTNAWTHASLDVVFGANGTIKLTIGNGATATITNASLLGPSALDQVTFELGATRLTGSAPAMTLRFDNVVVTTS